MDRQSLEDLFEPIGQVAAKRMFGGFGVFAGGVMFALYARGRIFLKGDHETASAFAQAGCEEFLYSRGEKTISLGYWTLPDRALDDPDELREWSALAIAAARRKQARAPAGRKKAKSNSKGTKSKV